MPSRPVSPSMTPGRMTPSDGLQPPPKNVFDSWPPSPMVCLSLYPSKTRL
jgi:hypothetical protein